MSKTTNVIACRVWIKVQHDAYTSGGHSGVQCQPIGYKGRTSGNVILSDARCCSSSLLSLLNRNTLNALCSWPVGDEGKNWWHSFFDKAPWISSLSSTVMHVS